MKKYLFLIVIGTVMTFTSCKKENMIIGKWEIISYEGDSVLAELYQGHIVYNFLAEEDYYFILDNNVMYHGWYSIENGKVNLKYFDKNQSDGEFRTSSLKISFSGVKTMKWQDKELKYTLKKIS